MKKIFLLSLIILSTIIYGDISGMGIKKNSDGTYSIVNNNIELKFSPQVGGRIISFTLDGYEFLSQKNVNELSFGSTLWPSPQSIWKWPPLYTLDGGNYTVENIDSKIKITSGIDEMTGLSFSKFISSPTKPNSIELPFVLTNNGDRAISISPWQISRVSKGGILFFPIGEGEQKVKYFDMAPTREIDKIVWYQSKINEEQKNHQLNMADGAEGWVAYAINQKLFVKKFRDINQTQIAPGEGEVLFYVCAECPYIEIEVQGAYTKLLSGESLEWNIEWFAFEIPSGIKVEIGSKDLVDFVRRKIN